MPKGQSSANIVVTYFYAMQVINGLSIIAGPTSPSARLENLVLEAHGMFKLQTNNQANKQTNKNQTDYLQKNTENRKVIITFSIILKLVWFNLTIYNKAFKQTSAVSEGF